MLTLIHGDLTEQSRIKLRELTDAARGKEIRNVAGKSLDETELIQALESPSLFGGDVLVVIEHFLSSANKREKRFSKLLSRLAEASKTADIILYEQKEIDKSAVAKLGPTTVCHLFKSSAVLFQYLDEIRPGNAARAVALFQKTVAREPAEVVFALMQRRVRQLIQIKDREQPEGLGSWQRDRLTNQAGHFTMDGLITMHRKLLETDIASKSGTSPFTLTQLIEQLIVSL